MDFTIIFGMQEATLKAQAQDRLYQWTLFNITAMGKRTICETVKLSLLPGVLKGLLLYVCKEMLQVT